MTLFLLYVAAFVGGLLTIFSPCILPVLPFVFGRTGRPFRSETLPLLAGLVLAFVFVASVGAAGAAWVATAADAGRTIALIVLAVAGVTLMSPRLASLVARPFVRLGSHLSVSDLSRDHNAAHTLILGVATGLVWAPCAGPILGLIAAGAAAGASPIFAATLFAAFGAGAAAALAVGVASSGRLMHAVRAVAGRQADMWLRRGLGAAAIATALIIATGKDAAVFGARGLATTGRAETSVLRHLVPRGQTIFAGMSATHKVPQVPTPDEGPLPTFDGATGWLNTGAPGRALAPSDLRGKVVVVNVWTFACYNCLNALPHIKALAAKYAGADVLVVGVHTPELARERVPDNVAKAVVQLGVTYPVAIDANYTIWRAFNNEYWPSVYIADRQGRIRYHHFGEGAYDDEDRVVAQLLSERDPRVVPAGKSPGAETMVAAVRANR